MSTNRTKCHRIPPVAIYKFLRDAENKGVAIPKNLKEWLTKYEHEKYPMNAPPTSLYDVLHDAECAGMEVPLVVDYWWKKETLLNEKEKEAKR